MADNQNPPPQPPANMAPIDRARDIIGRINAPREPAPIVPPNPQGPFTFGEVIAVIGVASARGIAMIQNQQATRDLTQLLDDWNLIVSDSAAITCAVVIAAATLRGSPIVFAQNSPDRLCITIANAPNPPEQPLPVNPIPIPEDGAQPQAQPAQHQPAGRIFAGDRPDLAGNQEYAFMMNVQAFIAGARGWIRDLVGCHQVKPLRVANVTNYFAQYSMRLSQPREVLAVIAIMSPFFPRLMEHPEFRDIVGRSTFMQYHTAYASSPSLIKRMVDGLGGFARRLFTDDDFFIANAAAQYPWNKDLCDLIPIRVIALTHAFLTANRVLPENWYQGEKARDNCPPMLYGRALVFFRRFAELAMNRDEMMNAQTLEELVREYLGGGGPAVDE